MEKLNLKLKKFLSFIIIVLGFYLFIFFIYLSFIRQRLPKNIPFELAEFRFYILIFILITFLYTIKQTIYYKPPSTFIIKILSIIATPFVYFDAFLKHNSFLYPYYYKLFFYMAKIFKESFIINDRLLLFFLFKIMPRVILLMIFLIDVFWLKKIEIFYYFIFLGLFPLIYNYIKYSIEFALEQYIKQLESIYTSVLLIEKGNFRMKDMFISDSFKEYEILGIHNVNAIYHDEFVSIREYIKIQAENILNKEITLYEYCSNPVVTKEFFEEYLKNHNKSDLELSQEDNEKLDETFNILENKLIYFYIFVHLNKNLQELFFIKKINLLIYILYFCTWLYILIISFYTLKDLSITINIIETLKKYAEIKEPFSDFIINEYQNK